MPANDSLSADHWMSPELSWDTVATIAPAGTSITISLGDSPGNRLSANSLPSGENRRCDDDEPRGTGTLCFSFPVTVSHSKASPSLSYPARRDPSADRPIA